MAVCETRYSPVSEGLLGVTVLPPHKKLKWVAALANEDLLEKLTYVPDSQALLALEEPGGPGHVQGGPPTYADVVDAQP